MINLLDMYQGKPYSPSTIISTAITAVATSIAVVDGSVFPAGPNLAVLGDELAAETVRYTAVSGNSLTGVERGIQEAGVGKAWPVNTPIARVYTELDHSIFISNIGELATGIDSLSETALAVHEFTATLLAEAWESDVPGAAPYYQTVAVSGVTPELFPVVADIVLDFGDMELAEEQEQQWALISQIEYGTDEITAWCLTDAPDVDINVQFGGVK